MKESSLDKQSSLLAKYNTQQLKKLKPHIQHEYPGRGEVKKRRETMVPDDFNAEIVAKESEDP